MNKKILISSIISICILVGVSFTSVVGYRSIESGVKISPLFNIRSSRAIDEDNKILTSDYVGKGDDFNLLIPDRDDKSELIEKFIDIIRKIDEKLLYRLIKSRSKYPNKNINDDDIKKLQIIRNKPSIIENDINNIFNPVGAVTEDIGWFRCRLSDLLYELTFIILAKIVICSMYLRYCTFQLKT